MIKLAICGAAGRMGSRIIALARRDKDLSVKIAVERPGHISIGSEVEGVKITDDTSKFSCVDCVIEFTDPVASLEHLKRCISMRKPIVIGTTGFNSQEYDIIKRSAKNIPIIFSPNMSIGVNLVFKTVQDMAGILKEYQVKIIEAHHMYKKDAPSGTAKKIAALIEESSGKKVDDIKSIREGEIIGDHEIIFEGEFDTITLKHSAKARDIFALGALAASKWLVFRKKGLYTMQDCLFGHEK